MHRHADDLTLDDPRIDRQPAVHRAVHVFRDDAAVVLVDLDLHDRRRVSDAVALIRMQVVRAHGDAATGDDARR